MTNAAPGVPRLMVGAEERAAVVHKEGMATFTDRREAGQELAQELSDYAERDDVVVLGLPRGGVPVAFEVAKALEGPLDVFVVRKLGVPQNPELAMGGHRLRRGTGDERRSGG